MKRYGTGRLHYRGPGKILASIWIHGRQHQRTFRKQCHALFWLKLQAERRIHGHPITVGSRPHATVGELLDEYVASCQRRGHRATTIATMTYDLRALIRLEGEIRVDTVSPQLLDDLENKMIAGGLKPSTAKTRRNVLLNFCKWAMERQIAIAPAVLEIGRRQT